MIQVLEQLDEAAAREVSAFLAAQPEQRGACGEHDPRWLSVLREALGHRPFALIARGGTPGVSPGASLGASDNGNGRASSNDGDGGAIRGYLPVALVASRLFGRFLVSLPYLNRAGVVAEDEATAAALIERAVELAEELDVQYVELRHSVPIEHESLGLSKDEKVRMVLDLPADEEALSKAVGPKVRNLVRKGDKHDLSIRWGGLELLDAFYDVFAVNMRDLGTPVYPKKLFGRIVDCFPREAELCAVWCEGACVAAALLVHDDARGLTQVPSASALREFNHTSANMWMYHKLLLRTMAREIKRFDFGRSSEGSGTYRFKKQWGAEPQSTVWQYHVRRGDVGSMRPDSPKNRRRVAMWQRLPVWLTRLVGPSIVRGIP